MSENTVDKLKVTRIRNVQLPQRSHPGDCGLDVFFPMDLTKRDIELSYRMVAPAGVSINAVLPAKFPEFDYNSGYLKNLYLNPGESILIPSGLKVNVPKGYCLKVENRSSVAAKKNLIVGSCVIDPGFQGEIYINLHYVGKPGTGAYLQPNDKIAQMVLYKIETPEVEEVATPVELYKDDGTSERGEGGFGSTDDKKAN